MRYGSRMLGVCHRYARTTADADDILQDAFIKVFDKMQQFKFEGSFEGWIRKIVVNTALKKYSLRRYDKEVVGYEVKDRDESGAEPSAYAHLTQKEILELIAQGYTNPQIADKIFLSHFTIDSHRKNLLAKLAVKNTASLIRLAVEKKLI